MSRLTIANALEKAREMCEEAVCHVGMANYAEREAEAQRKVREAFDTLADDLRRVRRAATKRRARHA